MSGWMHQEYLLKRCPFSILHIWYRKIANIRLLLLVNWNIIWIWSPVACFLLPRFYLWLYRLSFPWETCDTPGYYFYDIHLDLYSSLSWRCLWNASASYQIYLLPALFLSNSSCLPWIITASLLLLLRQALPQISSFQRNMCSYGRKVSSYSTWVFTVSYLFPNILGM